MKRALAALLCFTLAGCYTYVPVDPTRLTTGQRVRAYVTPETGSQIAGTLSAPVWYVAGDFVQPKSDSLQFLVSYYKTASGADITTDPTPLSLSPNALTKIEARRFSKGRSLLFTAAVTVGTAVVIQGIKSIFGINTTSDSHTDPGGTH